MSARKSKLIVPTMMPDMREQARRYGLDIPVELLPSIREVTRQREIREAAEPAPKPRRASKQRRQARRRLKAARRASR
jgi:hypothetical protein